jgi:hypothetical protein
MDIAAMSKGLSPSSVEAELQRYIEAKRINPMFVNMMERLLVVSDVPRVNQTAP